MNDNLDQSVVVVGNFHPMTKEILVIGLNNLGLNSIVFFSELTSEAVEKINKLSKKDFVICDATSFDTKKHLTIEASTSAQIRIVVDDDNKKINISKNVQRIFIDYSLCGIIGEIKNSICL